MPRQLTARRVVVGVLLLILAIVVVGNSWGHAVVDIKPEVYFAPAAMVGRYLGAWLPSPYLGSPSFNVGLAPVVALLAPLEAVGLGPEAAFKAFHLLLWVVGAVGAARLLRALSPTSGRWAAVVAGLVFVANPYAVVGGSTLAILLPYVVLPWFALAVTRSLRDVRSWRWPAASGAAFVAMSGMNAGVVPLFQLLFVIPLALVVGRAEGLEARQVAVALAKVGAFVAGVSLYWLVPTVGATGAGEQVIAASETVEGIAAWSSFPEVLRGMGMWTLYGWGSGGPWIPQFAPYVSSPAVVLATALWPVGGLLALRVAPPVLRHVGALGVLLGAVVMVGLWPGDPASVLGRALSGAFEAVPALLAFRTTNKVGAVLALSLALLLGHAVPVWLRRLGATWARVTAALAATVLVAGWVWPAVTGNLYISTLDVPAYWRQAAAALDQRDDGSRALFLPQTVRPHYRWTDERPDDLPNSLMSREAILPETTPNASAEGANLLAALGDLLGSEGTADDAVSTIARYLGAGDVLLRHDLVWEESGAPRPAVTDAVASADPGLVGVANFGQPGEGRGSVASVGTEALLPPLQLYAVRDPQGTVAARPAEGSVVVAGDAWAFGQLARQGLLGDVPLFGYAADLSPEELAERVGSAGHLVLSDTNRRRAIVANRLSAGFGPLLPEDDDPGATRALWGPDDQTVLLREGPEVTATQAGGAFYDLPFGQPDNALDGDPATSWLFGDFRRAPGARLEVRLEAPARVGRVSVLPTAVGAVHLDTVTVSAGGVERTVDVPDEGRAVVDLGGVSAESVTLRVDDIRGEGYSLVGVAELEIDGVDTRVSRGARLPLTLQQRHGALDGAARQQFAQVPLDVLMSRVRYGPGAGDDAETSLDREFALPDRRTFAVVADVRLDVVAAATYDELSGFGDEVEARASSTFFDIPDLRPSMALDRRSSTAWVPGDLGPGTWWEAEGPERDLAEVRVDQRLTLGGDGTPGREVTAASVLVDGVPVLTEARLGNGQTDLRLPPRTRGSVVRLVVEEVTGTGEPPRFALIDTGVRTPRDPSPPCIEVLTIDGRAVTMRPQDPTRLADRDREGTPWVACAPEVLPAGAHRLHTVPGFQLDQVALRDLQELGRGAAGSQAAPEVTEVSGPAIDQQVTVEAGAGPWVLRTGQAYDPRWEASVDGRSLGAPVVVDGWSTGWVVQDPGRHEVTVRYGPQRAADLALLVSALVLLGAAVLWGRYALARWSPSGRPGATASDTASATAPLPRSRARGWAVALVALAGLAVGWPGVAAAALAVLVVARWPRHRGYLVVAGAVLVLVAVVTEVLLMRSSGHLDAAVTTAPAPHWLAGAGLVLATVAALLPSGRSLGAGRPAAGR